MFFSIRNVFNSNLSFLIDEINKKNYSRELFCRNKLNKNIKKKININNYITCMNNEARFPIGAILGKSGAITKLDLYYFWFVIYYLNLNQ